MRRETDFAPNATPLGNTGTPPAPGWRVTETGRNYALRRFWHGPERGWSAPCYDDDPEEITDRARNTPAESQDGINWRDLTAATA